jgi:hypothetical protein
MSIYEVLVFVGLACVGGFACILYRSDTRPKSPGDAASKVAEGRPMFERLSKDRPLGDSRPDP